MEPIISKLRKAEVWIRQGQTIPAAAKPIGINDQTDYRWRKEYEGVQTDQAQQLRESEVENARLKKLVELPRFLYHLLGECHSQ